MYSFPSVYESWWLEAALKATHAPDRQSALQRLRPAVARLSDLFTTERTVDFGEYGKDPELLAAYGLFFFPQTYTRARYALEEIIRFRGWRPRGTGRVSILDLGTGTGGALMAAADTLGGETGQELTCWGIDRSELSLTLARGVAAAGGGENRTFSFHRGDLNDFNAWPQPGANGWDLILSSFALNEAFYSMPLDAATDWLRGALRRLTPGGVLLVLEPALRESSERLEQVRDTLRFDFTILGPCLHRERCPLLAQGEFWCHEVRAFEPPESLRELNRTLFRKIGSVKFSWLALGTGELNQGEQGAIRLISPVSQQKGRLVFVGCDDSGARKSYELQTRGLSRQEIKRLSELSRGDIVRTDAGEIKGEFLRVTEITRVCSK